MHKLNYTWWSSITIMLILSICSINVLGGNSFVKESAIIRFMLICSIDTFCFWISSFTTNYFNSICLAPLEYLSLEKKYNCRVITIHFQWHSNTINNFKPWNKVSQPISLNSSLKTCYKFIFHGRCNNNWCIQNCFHLFLF